MAAQPEAPASVRAVQSSFAGGELAPALHGRTDLSKYHIGAKLLLNYFVRPHGGASNRAGFQYIVTTKLDGAKKVSLIPFEASTDDSYMLEFGDQYMRVIRNEAAVLFTSGPNVGLPYEIATPYLEADLFDLVFEQSNDVLTITNQLYAPRDLSRLAHDNWTLAVKTFIPAVTAPLVPTLTATIGYNSSHSDYVATAYAYVVTAVNANGEESVASPSATVVNDLSFRPNYNEISWAAVAGAVQYNIFKGRSNVFGFIGFTPGLAFKDDNISPNLADGPQISNNPFSGSTNWPRTNSFYQQRQVFASTPSKQSGVFMTQSGSYGNMGASSPLKDSDAITFAIAARSKQTVLHMISVEDLLLFTPSTEFKVSGVGDNPISPTSIDVRPQSYYGSAKVRPIVAGAQILFVQAKGQMVRDIGYEFSKNRYVGDDLSILAQHLFIDRRIVRWAHARAPYSIIWCVMSDGGIISLTYLREHEIWAWTRHETKGFAEDVCVISEGQEDAVYIVLRRFVNGAFHRFIERLHTREFVDIRDAFFVDSGLSYDDPHDITAVTSASPGVFTSAAHGMADGVQVEAYGEVIGPNGEDLPIAYYTVRSPTTNTFRLEDDATGILVSTAGWPAFLWTGVYRIRAATFAGFDHLEGERVVALGDGNVYGFDEEEIRVVGGSITIPNKAARVHAGLSYSCRVQTLDVAGGQDAEQGVLRTITEVLLKVEKTRGLSAGPDFKHLREFKTRFDENYSQPTAALTDDIIIGVEPNGDRHGNVCVEQRYPLPVTILSHIPTAIFGD